MQLKINDWLKNLFKRQLKLPGPSPYSLKPSKYPSWPQQKTLENVKQRVYIYDLEGSGTFESRRTDLKTRELNQTSFFQNIGRRRMSSRLMLQKAED